MRYLPDGSWMQKADAHTIQAIGIPSLVLMERAALCFVEVLEKEQLDLSRPLVVCGGGNNGGDGFAIARLLYEKGIPVTVVYAGKEDSMSPECRQQMQILKNMKISVFTDLPESEYTIMIDAVFGVGLNREITGGYARLIERMNTMSGCKAAVDIPSGISAANGQILGTAFRADLTVSFQCEKLGTVLFPGKDYAGKVFPVDIGINTELFYKNPHVCYTLEKTDVPILLPKRKSNSHKGTYGRALMITGSRGMAGAAYLSARAAYAAGTGLVQIYTEESGREILQQLLPEAIISTYTSYEEEKLKDLLDWADVVCIGCGLGQSSTAEAFIEGVMRYCSVPCIIDADGIRLLARRTELLKQADFPVIMTPHMKEMSIFMGCEVSELVKERFTWLNRFIKEYPAVCVLKDARTAVVCREEPVFINTAGNHGMAKAGSGDVLAGIITGLLAQKARPFDSAVLGVYLHALGGDEARKKIGSYSLLAKDLIDGVTICLKKAEERSGI